MLMTLSFKNYLNLISIVLIASSCCKSVCDCSQDELRIEYQSQSKPCPSNFDSLMTVIGFNNLGDTINFNQHPNSWPDCIVELFYSKDYTWLIQSDSLGISDTVKVIDFTTKESDDKCCDCGPYVTNIQVQVNDTLYRDTYFIRKY